MITELGTIEPGTNEQERGALHMAEIVDFPPSPTLRPEQAVGTCMKTRWTQFLGIGITEAGDFEVVNSDMTAERALWLVKWAERWAMGLDEMEVE